MKKLFLFVLSTLSFYGCSSNDADDQPDPVSPTPPEQVSEIHLSPQNLQFDETGGTKAITVSTDNRLVQWTLSGDKSWCTPSQTTGYGGDKVTFTAKANDTSEERNVIFTFTCGAVSKNLTVTQKQKNTLTVTSSLIEIDAAGGEAIIEVKANINYQYEIGKDCETWITFTGTRALKIDKLIFNVAKNTEKEKREGTITITSGELSETVTISQAEEPYPTVHVAQKGTLASVLTEKGLDANSTVSLKITGVLNDEDFVTISQMSALRNLDLSEVKITELPEKAFYQSSITNLMLPKTLTIIGKEMFFRSSLQSVVIPNGVTTIGSWAFKDCPMITYVEIPASVETIETCAFDYCSKLATVIFEKGSKLRTIEQMTFSHTSLNAIEIPVGVETIGFHAFGYCPITSIEIPASVKTIEGAAFAGCSITAIEIPATVETIKYEAFAHCTKLATVTFEKGSKLKTIAYSTFIRCPITSIEIPAAVETIEEGAFKGCSELATVTFEKNSKLKTIEGADIAFDDGIGLAHGAFCYLTNLRTMDMSNCTQVKYIGAFAFHLDRNLSLFKIGTAIPPECSINNVFTGIQYECTLQVPRGCVRYYQHADVWGNYLYPITELGQ
ncbi:MAG: leucine-rich repeat protein [Alistipes sp.]|nr:leucine-rich repeat protein [Alistipes sp.]